MALHGHRRARKVPPSAPAKRRRLVPPFAPRTGKPSPGLGGIRKTKKRKVPPSRPRTSRSRKRR